MAVAGFRDAGLTPSRKGAKRICGTDGGKQIEEERLSGSSVVLKKESTLS